MLRNEDDKIYLKEYKETLNGNITAIISFGVLCIITL
jgi:hypothetical protein